MTNMLDLAAHKIGQEYILGALVPKNDPNWHGPWDCAEFCSWNVYQTTGKLYGCANNAGNPASADAYTGYWKRDADTLGHRVPVEVAAKTPGAFVLRYSGSGVTGHIVISDGKGGTIEAHSHKRGVIRNVVTGRRWDTGILVPWVNYDFALVAVPVAPPTETILRWTTPLMKGEKIREIQAKLNIPQDGIFGSQTFWAVRKFQNTAGLVPDGEVGTRTAEALGITF